MTCTQNRPESQLENKVTLRRRIELVCPSKHIYITAGMVGYRQTNGESLLGELVKRVFVSL